MTTDQRGSQRKIGASVDIGAFERNITFNQSALPNGQPGASYNQTLTIARATNFFEIASLNNIFFNSPTALTFAVIPITGQSLPPGLSLSTSGTISGTPTAPGTYTFTVKAIDTDGMAGAQIYTVLIQSAPTISDIADNATNEDTATGAIAFTVGDVETPAGSLTVAATSSNTTLVPNANITLAGSGANRTIQLTPAADQNGTTNITVTVTDADGGTATDQFVLTVNQINDPPSFTKGANQTIDEDAGAQTVGGWATNISAGQDETGQTLTFNVSITGTTGNLTFSSQPAINATTGTLTYTPAPDSNGTATVSVTLRDNGSNTPPNSNTSAAQTFTITVNPVNDAPTLDVIANPAAILEDASQQTINLSGISAGGGESQTLTVTATSDNTALIPNPTVNYTSPNATGSLSYTPVADANGSAVITVTVTDSGGAPNNSVSRTFTVNVTAVNDAPSFTKGADQTINEDAGAQTVSNWATNISQGANETGQILTFNVSITGTTGNLTFSAAPAINATTGTLTYTPTPNANGTATVSVTLSDNGSNTPPNVNTSAAQTFTITVNSVNDNPTISDIANRIVNQDTSTGAISFTVGDVDTAAANLSLSGSSSDTILVPNGNITFGGSNANRTVTISPAAGQTGTATITVTVTDADGGTGSDTFVLTVNGRPTISNIADQTINEDTPTNAIAFTVGDAETPAANLALSAVSSNQTLIPNGNITFGGSNANRTVTISPALNQFGTTTITVTVTDASSATASASFLLTVNPVNDNPTVSGIGDQFTNVNTPITVGFTVTDAETPAGSLTPAGSSSNQTLVPDANIAFGGAGANRTIQLTPAANQTGTTIITITVTDADGGTGSRTFLLTVRPMTVLVTNGNDSDAGSLRSAVSTIGEGGTINFAPDVTLITLTGGEIVLDRNITINGTGANKLTVSGNNNARVFHATVPSPAVVTISGVTVSNGRAGDYGGGILLEGTGVLNILNCAVSNNSAAYGVGAGIANIDTGTINISGSTISGNSSIGGGGIYEYAGQTNITNSTISGNSADQGGGIYLEYGDGSVTVINSTVSRNSASQYGGGILSYTYVTLRNSIVALNTTGYAAPDVYGTINSLDYNLIKDTSYTAFGGTTTHNIYGQDPKLAPLGNYGGATQTHALLQTSPALDAGNNCVLTANGCGDGNAALSFDQRGSGAARKIGANVDTGAFERNITFNQSTLPNGNTGANYNQTLTITRQTSFAEFNGNQPMPDSPAAPFTFSIVPIAGQQLPPGLSLASNGTISGTPTAAGTYTFTVKATDADGTASVQQYTMQVFGPTAAMVSISGRVIMPQNLGLTNALVTLTDMQGGSRTLFIGKAGRFTFTEVAAGKTYILSVQSKRYRYAPQAINVTEDMTEVNFAPQ